ncbi:putative cupin superfamily protein [Rhodococcus sp. 27YEA15]|uniref:cupin domain-containing protein n=1 Tax=Rhodococcus sp. 27YEA15 TaxID=3156259 RepID=UPI003C7CF765
MALSTIEAVSLDRILLEHDPINSDWIISGTPVARAAQWSASKDGSTTTHVWDCTKGRFRWYFHADEIVHIMEGSVTVEAEGVAKRTLTVGDAALFRAGSWSEWHVEDYVRKHAILSVPLHPTVSLGVRALRRVGKVFSPRPRPRILKAEALKAETRNAEALKAKALKAETQKAELTMDDAAISM